MKRISKKILILFAGVTLLLVSTIVFARSGTAGVTTWGLMHEVRMQAIQQLITSKFDRFVTMPFGPGNDHMHVTWSLTYPDYPDYLVTTGIDLQDDLDILLEKKIQTLESERPFYTSLASYSLNNIILSDDEIASLQKVYLFKSAEDLKDLGYVVSSYRTRINNDAKWRQDNISISYWNIGNVRVLNPDQKISFMDEIHYDPAVNNWKRDTVNGLALMWGVSSVKWGGICGAARGINAVLLSNKAFEIEQRYNHTRTYKNMYQNEINGQEFRIPWIDVAVYRMWSSQKDFVFKNIREYPVVLVMNYDGSVGWMEELFVLSHEEDRGILKYIGHQGNCYTREANSVPFTSCYAAVSGR